MEIVAGHRSVNRVTHAVDQEFVSGPRTVFSDDEIVELVFARSIFSWGNKFSITMHMDTEASSTYQSNLEYREEPL